MCFGSLKIQELRSCVVKELSCSSVSQFKALECIDDT